MLDHLPGIFPRDPPQLKFDIPVEMAASHPLHEFAKRIRTFGEEHLTTIYSAQNEQANLEAFDVLLPDESDPLILQKIRLSFLFLSKCTFLGADEALELTIQMWKTTIGDEAYTAMEDTYILVSPLFNKPVPSIALARSLIARKVAKYPHVPQKIYAIEIAELEKMLQTVQCSKEKCAFVILYRRQGILHYMPLLIDFFNGVHRIIVTDSVSYRDRIREMAAIIYHS